MASLVALSSSRVWKAMIAAPSGGQITSGLIRSVIRWGQAEAFHGACGDDQRVDPAVGLVQRSEAFVHRPS